MDRVYMQNLIVCSKMRRGAGNSAHSPIRVVTEIFNAKGDAIAENDPCGNITTESLLDFLKYRYSDIPEDKHIQNIASYYVHGDDDD